MPRSTPRAPQVRVLAATDRHGPERGRRFAAIATALLGAVLAVALATLPGLSRAETYPPVLQPFIANGLKIEKHFKAASGLTGWVVLHEGEYSVVFTTADGKTLISGALVDEKGQNLTAEYARTYIPKPDLSQAFTDLENSQYIAEGTLKDPKSIIYIFTDANCPFCHKTWQALQPYEKVGLQVRWVVVAALGPNSMDKAIEIMTAKDRLAAFRKDMESFGQSRSLAKDMNPQAKPAQAAMVQQQTQLMTRFGIRGTPGIVWKDATGKVAIKFGMPRLSEIPGITGLPRQATTDPSLSRFE